MVQLDIKTYPNPCLRIKTKEVKEFDPALKAVLRQMADVMYLSQGIGLAATQVGLDSSVFVTDIGEGLLYFVNPEIIESSNDKSKMEEGCLSLPGITVNVTRPAAVKIKAQNEKGDFFIREFKGLMAKAVQHEIDHLKGRLIVDYLDPIRRFLVVRNFIFPETKKKTCEVVCSARD